MQKAGFAMADATTAERLPAARLGRAGERRARLGQERLGREPRADRAPHPRVGREASLARHALHALGEGRAPERGRDLERDDLADRVVGRVERRVDDVGVDGEEIAVAPEQAEEEAPTVDLMEALRRSVEEAKSAKQAGNGAAKKKAAPKKASARPKKTAAR